MVAHEAQPGNRLPASRQRQALTDAFSFPLCARFSFCPCDRFCGQAWSPHADGSLWHGVRGCFVHGRNRDGRAEARRWLTQR